MSGEIERHDEWPGGELVVREVAIGAYYRHKKTGGVYQVLMLATIEATMVPAVVYGSRSSAGIGRWVRPLDEFCDGRFEPVDMAVRS